jgi:hypothetical protein
MRRSLALLGLPLLLLAGCAAPGADPAAPPATNPGDASIAGPDHRWEGFARRAAEVADAWRPGPAWRSGYVPLDEATVLVGDPGFTDETKQAFLNGWYRDQIPLPASRPADGTIRFPDGVLRVPLVSAADAYAQLHQADPPPCEGRPMDPGPRRPKGGPTIEPGPDGWATTSAPSPCVPLTVTGVTLGSASVRTSRGEASVPAWLFTVEGLRAPVARLAVAPSAVGAVPEGVAPTGRPDDGVLAATDLRAVQGNRVDYRVGAGACDGQPTPLVLERDDVVVLGAGVLRATGPCTMELVLKPVTVTLKAPLGARAVLDVASGTPLVVRR